MNKVNNLWLDGGILRDYYSDQADIVLPDFVYEVGSYVFRNMDYIRSVTIPEGALDIGYGTFSGCTGLTRVVIPDTVQRIDMYAFSGCEKLTQLKLPKSLKILRDSTFINCTRLREMTIPENVKKVEFHAFFGCVRLKEIRGLGVTELEDPIIDQVSKCIFPLIPMEQVESRLMRENLTLGYMTAPELYGETGQAYADYAVEKAERLARLSVDYGFSEPLRYLNEHELLQAQWLEELVAKAQERGRADITAYLLDCKEKQSNLNGDSDDFWDAFDEEFAL